MNTKSMKYEIKYEKELYDLLSDIQYVVYRLKNKATSMAWDWQQFSFGYNERVGEFPKEKDILGKTLAPDISNLIKNEFGNFVSSTIVDVAIQESVKKFKKDSPKINRGEVSIANYRRDGSFPLRARNIKKLTKVNSKTYTAKFSLLSEVAYKEKGLKSGQVDVVLRTGNGANVILDRIISGEYKMCDSRITKTKNKFYLLLTYQFESEKKLLDKNKIMGIDVGISVPATLALSDDNHYREFVGNGKTIRDFEEQVIARKKRIQESRKWAGKGSVGHGRKTRLKALDKIGNKISNFKQTQNHNWSKYIVDEAIRLGCGTIQMEDLTGISKENSFLKNWTFYQLKQFITYKAEQVGIKVVEVNPKYTSSRCNRCGVVHIDNRTKEEKKKSRPKWRPTQEQFHCQTCDYKVNADVNAARNIAMKDIDKIIKKQVELQAKVANHNMEYELDY